MALACEPELLIADEPTTALDVTVQAGILRLIHGLRRTRGLVVMPITHDLGVLSAVADTVTVMYAGRIVESGPTSDVIRRARHPYTRGLLDSLPHPELVDQPLGRFRVRHRVQPSAQPGARSTRESMQLWWMRSKHATNVPRCPRCTFTSTPTSTCSPTLPPTEFP